MRGWFVIILGLVLGVYHANAMWLLGLALLAIAVRYSYEPATLVPDLLSNHPVQGTAVMFFLFLLFSGLLYGIGYVVGSIF